MKCPECNHQNPDDAAICEKCYLNFSLVRTSKLAILSMILGLSSLFLFVITGLPAIVLGIISIVKIRKSKGLLTGLGLARAGINSSLVLMLVFFLLWRVDAPPIPNDYTISDLRSAPAEYEESYHLLRSLIYLFIDPREEIEKLKDFTAFGENATGIESKLQLPEGFIEKYINDDEFEPLLSSEDIEIINDTANIIGRGTSSELIETLNKNTDTIKRAWDNTQAARDVIHQLNDFPEIADLEKPFDMAVLHNILPLLDFNRLYIAYANIQTKPDEIFMFTNELVIFDSVVRKLNLNKRSMISKSICWIIMSNNIKIANSIANKLDTSKESLDLLVNHFKPITKEQISLRNPIIFHYLTFKESITIFPETNLEKKLSLFKENSTLRILKNRFDDWLNTQEENNNIQKIKLSALPTFYIFPEPVFPENTKDYQPSPFSLYTLYNPTGSVLIKQITTEQYTKNQRTFTSLKKIDDLLQIVLSKRLGKDLDLSTLAYGDEYIIDIENKKIFSPGRDGIKDTKDDITLPINPEVLHLSE